MAHVSTHWTLAALLAAACFGGCTQADLRLADEIAAGYGLEPGEPVVEKTGEGYDIKYADVMRDIHAARGGRRASTWYTAPRFGLHPGDRPEGGVPWNFPWPGGLGVAPGPELEFGSGEDIPDEPPAPEPAPEPAAPRPPVSDR